MTSTLLLNNNGSSELNSFFSISASTESSSSVSSSSSSSSAAAAAALSSSLQTSSSTSADDVIEALTNDTKSTSSLTNLLMNSSRNLVDSPVQVEIPVVHVQPVGQSQTSPTTTSNSNSNITNNNALSSCSPFIDPSELKNKFYEFSSKFLLILLDCRTINDFNHKNIKDSVHLNCRDRLTKKRLQSRKLTVKDLISSEEIKNKFEIPVEHSTSQKTTSTTLSNPTAPLNAPIEHRMTTNEMKEPEIEATNDTQKSALLNDNNMIVLYDDTTSDLSDLQSDKNPLKIVQENIKQSGYKKDCRILKGGFKSFFESFPEFCNIKDCGEQQRAFFNKYSDRFKDITEDQRQSAIEAAVMTEITPYLYLGNEQDAKNCDILEKKGIYYILNVTRNIPFYNSTNSMSKVSSDTASIGQFCFKRIAVNDCESQNLMNHFDEAFDFIDQAKLKNQKVLVHCQAGISRSPTFVIAYLMSRFNLEMNDAYSQVKQQRPIIGPNLIFMSQLMDFDLKLNGQKKQQQQQHTGVVSPINVVHTHPTHTDHNTPLNYTAVSSSQHQLQNQRSYTTPPSTPIIQSTQIEVQFISNINKKENSENNSPDVCHSTNSNSYFKLAQATSSATKCNNSSKQETKNNSILVFN